MSGNKPEIEKNGSATPRSINSYIMTQHFKEIVCITSEVSLREI
jgi:hypothetical protein